MPKILILDDEKDMLSLLKRIISGEGGHEVTVHSDPFKALSALQAEAFDLVITDLKMPKMNGIQALEAIKQINPDIPVVIMTAYATIETTVEAIKKGAFDYIAKPFRRERILVTTEKALKWHDLLKENRKLRKFVSESENFSEIVTNSPLMHNVIERIRQVAPTMGTVLITGASGTGKELVARAIHRHSLRADGKLITLNCAALPPEIMESELFGHVKGAFTGAYKDTKGVVEEAHKGTLFLDEIGELNPRLQTRLLRLLQHGEYKPVGSATTKTADLRFIAATNRDLTEAIQERRFREDLYYRLNVIRLDLPGLKERSDDIPLLSYHFLAKYNRINNKEIRSISSEAMNALKHYQYTGNVRELENIIERGVIFCQGDELTRQNLYIEDTEANREDLPPDERLFSLPFKDAREEMLKRFYRAYIESLLVKNGGNVTQAAEKAGIQRQYLHRLIKELQRGKRRNRPRMSS
jgi:DNA-binding NtrC family response regulator